jgi:hypothetical protein
MSTRAEKKLALFLRKLMRKRVYLVCVRFASPRPSCKGPR